MADLTKQIRNKYKELLNSEFERFKTELNTLHGDKYVAAYLAMSKFVIPTISSVQVDSEGAVATVRDLLAEKARFRNETT